VGQNVYGMAHAQLNQPYVGMMQNPIGQPYQGNPQMPYQGQQVQIHPFKSSQGYPAVG